MAVDQPRKPEQSGGVSNPAEPRLCHLHIRLNRTAKRRRWSAIKMSAALCCDGGLSIVSQRQMSGRLFHSYAFDFSVWEIWGALLYGGRLVMVPYWISRSPEAFHESPGEQHSVTVLNQTPSSFYQLMRSMLAQGADDPCSSARDLWRRSPGATASCRWFARHGDDCPHLVNMYGITETTVHVTLQRLKRGNAHGSRKQCDRASDGGSADLSFWTPSASRFRLGLKASFISEGLDWRVAILAVLI